MRDQWKGQVLMSKTGDTAVATGETSVTSERSLRIKDEPRLVYRSHENLAQLVLYLFHYYSARVHGNSSESSVAIRSIDTVVDLCSRNCEMSAAFLEDPYVHRCVAVDMDATNWNEIVSLHRDSGDALGEGIRHLRLLICEKDAFDIDRERVCAPSSRSTCVYCRPPAQKPFTRFPGSLDRANEEVGRYLEGRADYLRFLSEEFPVDGLPEKKNAPGNSLESGFVAMSVRDAHADEEASRAGAYHLLSVPEWYFVFQAASLIESSADSCAVVLVPNRLLNLAKAADGRRLLSDLKLLSAVILLPGKFAPDADDRALLVLARSGGRDIFYYDGRNETDADGNPLRYSEFIESLERAGLTDPAVRDREHRLEFDDALKVNWSFLKTSIPDQMADVDYVPLAEWTWTREVKRGVSRKYVEDIDYEQDLSDDAVDIECSYISIAPYINGAIVPLMPGDPTKVDNLPYYPRKKIGKIKSLDPRYPVLLISRIGPPFKLVLLDTSYWEAIEGSVYEPAPYEVFVPADGLIYISLWNETAARYLLAYLSSAQGQQCLEMTAHGNRSKQLSTKDLRMMSIPDMDRDEQKRLGDYYFEKQRKYEEALGEVEAAQERAQKLAGEKRDMMKQ